MTRKHSRWATDADVVTESYRGPDRRKQDENVDDDTISREIRYDDKGNPVLDVRTTAPRRRDGDDTIDLIKALDADSLDLKTED